MPISHRRILLVDDSELYRCALVALLEDAGHTVDEAASLTQARDFLSATEYDLVLVDVHLADERGLDLIPEVRRASPGARLAVLSGAAESLQVPDADRVLSKGMDTASLCDEIQRLADTPPSSE